jgi:hypothetical protein
MDWLRETWPWILRFLASSGVSLAVAIFAVRYFLRVYGESFIHNHFDRKLSELKHQQDKDLENVKHSIQTLSSRISKVHEKEFEVLPRAWFLLNDAVSAAASATRLIHTRPDFIAMPEELFDEFLRGHAKLSDYQKSELKAKARSERQGYYAHNMRWIELSEMQEKHRIFQDYLIEQRIVMAGDIKRLFDAAAYELGSGIVSYEAVLQYNLLETERQGLEAIAEFRKRLPEIEEAITARLNVQNA